MLHLEEVSLGGQTADEKATAQGLVTVIKNYRFVHSLHFLTDLFSGLQKLSLEFHRNDICLPDTSCC